MGVYNPMSQPKRHKTSVGPMRLDEKSMVGWMIRVDGGCFSVSMYIYIYILDIMVKSSRDVISWLHVRESMIY